MGVTVFKSTRRRCQSARITDGEHDAGSEGSAADPWFVLSRQLYAPPDLFLGDALAGANQSNMMAMMAGLSNNLDRHVSSMERAFCSHAIDCLAEASGTDPHVENWAVSRFDVEFDKPLGGGGL